MLYIVVHYKIGSGARIYPYLTHYKKNMFVHRLCMYYIYTCVWAAASQLRPEGQQRLANTPRGQRQANCGPKANSGSPTTQYVYYDMCMCIKTIKKYRSDIHTYIHTSTSVHQLSVHTCTHIHTYTHTSTSVHQLSVHTYINTYMHTYIKHANPRAGSLNKVLY